MYELRQGTARLVNALYGYKDDSVALQRIASALHYFPQQLLEDIQALNDFYSQARIDQDGEEL